MPLIDADGFIFGRVSVIDVLVLLVAVSLVFGGLTFTADPMEDPDTRQIVIDADEQPGHVVDALEEGSVDADDIVSIDGIDASERDEDAYDLHLTVTIVVTFDEQNRPLFEEERIYVGGDIELDFDEFVLDATVLEVRD